MRILLTNDDGVYSPGLRALAKVFSSRHQVVVVAPSQEHSGQGHAITLATALGIHSIEYPHTEKAYRIDGTPADCVKIALTKLVRDPINVIVSGINNGLNTGVSVFYSGTVAGAVEGALNGIGSIAVSTEQKRRPAYEEVASHLLGVVEKLKLTPGSCYNINYPDPGRVAWGGVLAAKQSIQGFTEVYDEQKLRDGGTAYHLSGNLDPSKEPQDTDVALIKRGAITLTPIRKDFTDPEGLQHIRNIFGNMPPPLPVG